MQSAKILNFISIFLLLANSLFASEAQFFPYVYTPEAHLDVGSRAESRVEEMSTSDIMKYLNKYLRKPKLDAPIEELEHFARQKNSQSAAMKTALAKPEGSKKIKLAFTGDIMWIQNGWNDFMTPEMHAFLGDFDGVFGNLETPIAKSFKVPSIMPDAFFYNSDPGLVKSFTNPKTGKNYFTAVSFANNHVLDTKDKGALETLEFLNSQNIPYSGIRENLQQKSYASVSVNGIKIGFFAATFGTNYKKDLANSKLLINLIPGVSPEPVNSQLHQADLSQVKTALTQMKQEGIEYKIVSLHWGHEFEYYPTPTQMQIAREIIGMGADLILGGHPHVPQPTETCLVNPQQAPKELVGSCIVEDGTKATRNAFVIYNLGNFVSNMFTPRHKIGVVQEIILEKEANGKVEWSQGPKHFVYNMPGNSATKGKRKLYPLEAYLEKCRASKCKNKMTNYISFLREHVGP